MNLEHLPVWLQVVISIAAFFGTALAAVLGYTKRKLGDKLESQSSQDAVVISAAFADGKLLRELLEAIVELRESNVKCTEREVEAASRMTDATYRLNDNVVRLTDFLRDKLK